MAELKTVFREEKTNFTMHFAWQNPPTNPMNPMIRSIQLTALALTALLSMAHGSEQIVDFPALEKGADNPPPLRWKDPDTGASIFNLSFSPEGALKGENYLPGSIELPLSSGLSEAKIRLKYLPQPKGVVAVTLTSLDGRQRLRIQYDKSGISMAWRDLRVEQEPVRFRKFPVVPTGESQVLQMVVNFDENQITVTEGDLTDVVKGNADGAPDIDVGQFRTVVVSVEADSVLQELRIEEK